MLKPGDKTPTAELAGLDGARHKLRDLARSGPVVLAFFKVSCPTCQFALPYLDRFAQASGTPVMYVSQNSAQDTRAFLERFALSSTALIDDPARYEASNGFQITHVPSLFVVEPDGRIAWASNGFHRGDLEELGARFGTPMFRSGENVPEWKPG